MNRNRVDRILAALAILLAGCRSGCTSERATTTAEDGGNAVAEAPAPLRPALKQTPPPPDIGSPPADAERTATGLASKVLVPGSGTTHPARSDTVTVHHTGWTRSGRMFDSSVVRGQPVTFRVGSVIRGWTEGLELMVVGEKRRLWIPAALAYGERPDGAPGAEQGGTPWGDLVYDLELLAIQPGPVPAAGAQAPDAGTRPK